MSVAIAETSARYGVREGTAPLAMTAYWRIGTKRALHNCSSIFGRHSNDAVFVMSPPRNIGNAVRCHDLCIVTLYHGGVADRQHGTVYIGSRRKVHHSVISPTAARLSVIKVEKKKRISGSRLR